MKEVSLLTAIVVPLFLYVCFMAIKIYYEIKEDNKRLRELETLFPKAKRSEEIDRLLDLDETEKSIS